MPSVEVPSKKLEMFPSSTQESTGRDSSNHDGRESSMGEVERPISDVNLLRIMECPVCNEFPAPPIYCCEKGHFTCNTCMKLLQACSLCESRFTEVRNFALESIIENSNFKCRYARLGCPSVIMGFDLNRHASECLYRPLDCQEPGCLFKNIPPVEYTKHLVDQHGIEVQGCCDKEFVDGRLTVVLNQNEDPEDYPPYFVKTMEKAPATFVIMSKKYKTFMCWWAACLQPENFANHKVSFSLEAKNNPDEISVRWTLPLQPIWKEFDEIRDTGRCAVLPLTNLFALYADEKSWNLKVEFIKKEKTSVHRKPFNDFLFLMALMVISVVAVVAAILAETDWFSDTPSGKGSLNQTFVKNDNPDFSEEQEYIGYRGFYYRA